MPEDMGGEERATWINWIHLETQALLEDLNEEIRLQNEADDPLHKTHSVRTHKLGPEGNRNPHQPRTHQEKEA